ncbi:MAG: phospholipase D-like domain-containing protein [Bacteroidales bacterium]|nr:phospholipase D-like domain-containing protein [Bacteroidales bacterium]
MIRASFKNIQSSIIESIQKAEQEIKIAVAWFTNKEILGELVEKLDNGIRIHLLISDDRINSKLNKESYLKHGGEIKIIPSEHNKFLHEKFAIFDSSTLIVGSYNYTYNAEYKNYESIIITDSEQLIKQYSIRFNNILNKSIEYEQKDLISNSSNGIIESENELEKMELDLKDELLNTLSECKKLKVKLNYNGIYELIEKYGAIGTPKRLVSTGIDSIQSGFVKLWEIKRLDLTFEAIITKEKYKLLFDEKTINEADKRLEKFK